MAKTVKPRPTFLNKFANTFPSDIKSALNSDISSIAITDIYDAYDAVIHTQTSDYPSFPSSPVENELRHLILAFQLANGKMKVQHSRAKYRLNIKQTRPLISKSLSTKLKI
jgi:hypothetical protein